MKIQPLYDRVLIEPMSGEDKTAAGIVLPDTIDKEKPEQGKIIAMGKGRLGKNGQLKPLAVKIGDKVLFTKYGPNQVKINGKDYLIAREDDILAIIK